MKGLSNDIFRILIATDNHLGYAEESAERNNDSLNTFEEILELAVENNVDFILLGGDLFHENNPSRHVVVSCMQLLKKYTFGDKPVYFDFVSDPTENFPNLRNPNVNYQDPNLNISIPVFSIHGNHDDPSGMGQFCALDLLSTAGLVNYFGRTNDLKEITVSPILLIKGNTKLALYGLSSIKDERLFRLFKENKVKMLRPKEDTEDWFNVLVLHQNHVRHSPTNYIPEEFLDNFLHLVIWGHEHECIIEPRESKDGNFFVIQPGSSVVTSLCPGEAVQKKVALLEVNSDKQMRVTPLPLKTVRPFIFDDMSLADLKFNTKNKEINPVEEAIEKRVWSLVEQAKEQITGHPRQPSKPLVRLRVEYTAESQMFNVFRFGHKFGNSIANPDDVILFRKKKMDSKTKDEKGLVDDDVMDSVFNQLANETKVEDLVKNYFSEIDDQNQLQLLTERGLAHAVSQYVEKHEKDSIECIFRHQLKKTKEYLMKVDDFNEDEIENYISNFHGERNCKKKDEEEDLQALEDLRLSKRFQSKDEKDSDDGISDNDIEEQQISRPVRGGRGSRRARGRAGGAASKSRSTSSVSAIEDDDDISELPTFSRGRGRGRSRATRSTGKGARTPSIREAFQVQSQKRNRMEFLSDSD